MTYLVVMTIVWAFSFSLIGVYLAVQVDAYFSVLIRVLLATIVFFTFYSSDSCETDSKTYRLGSYSIRRYVRILLPVILIVDGTGSSYFHSFDPNICNPYFRCDAG